METYIQQGKDFIENELHYSFNSMETKTVAKRLLMAFTKGFELANTYWQKGMFTQQQVDEMLDHQVCMTTAQMLEKQSDTEKLESFDIGFTSGSNEATNRLLTVMYTEDEVTRLFLNFLRIKNNDHGHKYNTEDELFYDWFNSNKK